jgi:hypothetical protein
MRPSIRPALSLAALLGLSATTSLASADDAVSTTTTTTTTTSGNNVPTPTSEDAELSSVSDSGEPQMETGIAQRTFPNRPLLATGSVLLVSSYVPAVIGAAISDRSDADRLYIPVAGPWMTLAQGPEEKAGHKALLVADGALQGLGALMMVSSLLIPERTTQNWYLIGQNQKVRVGPQHMRAGFGLGASGRF